MLLALALSGCAVSGGGGGGGGGGPVIGSPCDPASQQELCSGSARVTCASPGSWTLVEVCPNGSVCMVSQAAQPGMYQSQCAGGSTTGGDTVSSTDSGNTKDSAIDTSSGGCPGGCDDGIACTIDACKGSTCSHTPSDEECEDGNPCTKDQCQGGGCKSLALLNQPCNDGDTCTTGDTCNSSKNCVGKPMGCDDGDPCTADSCQNGSCSHDAVSGCADGSSMDGALPINLGNSVQGDLSGGVRWYTFDGDAGQFIAVVLQSAQKDSPYDTSIIDSVVEVWSGSKVIAANDDNPEGADNDSLVMTVLPQSGTYYIKVSECWDWLAANPNPNLSCAPPQNKSQTQFGLVLLDNTTTSPPIATEEAESNNSQSAANTLTYGTNSQGQYLIMSLVGQLSGSDSDWFSLVPPTDTPVKQGRATAYFSAWAPTLPLGTGSSLTQMTVSLIDKATGATVSQLTGSAPQLQAPVKLGQTYLLQVSGAKQSGSGKPFYILDHYNGGSNPQEAKEAANNAFATAEQLPAPAALANGNKGVFVGGDLIDSGADVDHFAVSIPSGYTKLSVFCAAASSGSGVQGFAVTVLNSSGQPVSGGTATEGSSLAVIDKLSVSGSKVVIKLQASGQNPSITGAFYECGFSFGQ